MVKSRAPDRSFGRAPHLKIFQLALRRKLNLMGAQKRITDFLDLHGTAIVGAIVILVVGIVLAVRIGRLVHRFLQKRDLEPPVRLLLVRLTKLGVIVFTLVLAAGQLGVQVMPLVAGIGVVGVGIGLATQGVLSNVVAGLTIIFTKPFRVGQYIELLGVAGQVKSIDLFSTTVGHADQSDVIIPNRKIVGEILHNYGATRQLDVAVGVAYDTDLNRLQTIVSDVLSRNKRILKDPAPVIGISALADSRIAVAVKPWVNVTDYGPAQAELYQRLIERFRAEGIEMPYPQREVRLLDHERKRPPA